MVVSPRGSNILESTWALKKKGYSDTGLKRRKARLCVRNDQQIEGHDLFETYGSVVTWVIVRLIVSMILPRNVKSKLHQRLLLDAS